MVSNIREARKCLKAKLGRAGGLTQRQRHMLEDMGAGTDFKVYHLRETLGTDLFDAISLDKAHNSLLAGYGAVPDDWKLIAKAVNAKDFRTNNATALSGVPNLSTVLENDPYVNTTMIDQYAYYTVVKYGNLLPISMEAYANDEIGAFNAVAGELGKAGKRTLNEFVLGTCFDDNPTCTYDSASLFVDATHANLQAASTPLNVANVELLMNKMLIQTGRNSEQLYIRPWKLLVNPSLAVTAARMIGPGRGIMNQSMTPDTDSNATTTFIEQGSHNPIGDMLPGGWATSPHINAVAADWYIIANPAEVPIVEVGFLNGNQEPEIMKEPENTGSSFATDAVSWKVRFCFGGAPVDHRGAQKADAA